jgi:hypothetical protein
MKLKGDEVMYIYFSLINRYKQNQNIDGFDQKTHEWEQRHAIKNCHDTAR